VSAFASWEQPIWPAGELPSPRSWPITIPIHGWHRYPRAELSASRWAEHLRCCDSRHRRHRWINERQAAGSRFPLH
jgi:hypothetical protein